jgi:hypothetical protein
MVSADSLTVKTNKYPSTYNIGDSISISGTAAPNTLVSITILDPNNTTKDEGGVHVPSNGNYSLLYAYTLEETDLPGTWRVNVKDLSSNETMETTFQVTTLWERLEAIEGQLAGLQNSVENLSSRLSAIESLSMVIYGAIATSIIAAVISIMALTRYLQKRNIYNRLTGKTKKDKTGRR